MNETQSLLIAYEGLKMATLERKLENSYETFVSLSHRGELLVLRNARP